MLILVHRSNGDGDNEMSDSDRNSDDLECLTVIEMVMIVWY